MAAFIITLLDFAIGIAYHLIRLTDEIMTICDKKIFISIHVHIWSHGWERHAPNVLARRAGVFPRDEMGGEGRSERHVQPHASRKGSKSHYATSSIILTTLREKVKVSQNAL